MTNDTKTVENQELNLRGVGEQKHDLVEKGQVEIFLNEWAIIALPKF